MAYPNLQSAGRTNFGSLGTEALSVWSRDFWSQARNHSFLNQFAGKGANALVQRVTDLTKTKKGTRAVITLVNDLTGDGVMGDTQMEGYEEKLAASQVDITIDQLRNATRSEGKLDEQKQIVNFREESRDKLAYWAGDRIDQLGFLTMSGIPYTKMPNGANRPDHAVAPGQTGYKLADLEFAADVTAPSDERHLIWTPELTADGSAETGQSVLDAATAVSATITGEKLAKPSYNMIVRLKAYAKNNYIRGIRGKGNDEIFHLFMTPDGMATLRLDPDFIANVRHAGVRGGKNELFAGSSSVLVDGVMIHEFRHVYSTEAAADGAKIGDNGAQDGQRALFCGAQSMAMADLGSASWNEDDFDYGNQQGISIGKMLGFRKPVFKSNYTHGGNAKQDFGIIALDTAV
jgi:N4-gp56 family major capsid protein